MKAPLRLLLLLALLVPAVSPASDWRLVWSDEFDKPGLPDKSKWDYETGYIRNNELQYYTKERRENTRVEGGMLVIEGRKEKFANPDYRSGAQGRGRRNAEFADYTSGSINTFGKASFLYGRIEVRAKIPQGKGVWPAIWMMGTNRTIVGWPRCGEIDIMEFVGKEPTNVHATVHYHKDGKHGSKGSKISTNEPFADFHVFAVEWNAERMDFFYDDRKYFTFEIDPVMAGPENPFRKPHYLLINLALGGQWGGPMDDSVLPQKYLIDYVRIYQQAKQ